MNHKRDWLNSKGAYLGNRQVQAGKIRHIRLRNFSSVIPAVFSSVSYLSNRVEEFALLTT